MFKTILVPIDGSEHAKKAVTFASDLATKYGARIVFLHVLLHGATAVELRNLVNVQKLPQSAHDLLDRFEEVQKSAVTASGFSIAIPFPDGVLESIGNALMDDAEGVAKKHGATDVGRILKGGGAADVILSTANEEKIDLIVMGTRGLSDLRGLLVGSVSHKVSHLSKCTCVTVK